MANRFSPLRRPRMRTDEEFVRDAVSDARAVYWRASETLAYDPYFGDGARATENQAAADSVDTNDIAAAVKTTDEARKRARHLLASAEAFDVPNFAETLRGAARDLQDAADDLEARVRDFSRFALDADVDSSADDEDVTAEEAALLEDPPVLIEVPRAAGTGPGAPHWTVSAEDLERLWVMVRPRRARARADAARARAPTPRTHACALSRTHAPLTLR